MTTDEALHMFHLERDTRYSPKQVAALLGWKTGSAVYKALRQGHIEAAHVKCGPGAGLWVIPGIAVAEWISRQSELSRRSMMRSSLSGLLSQSSGPSEQA